MAGNLGGDERLGFSVIGDAVNIAARVQDATRDTGDVVLLAENTRAALRNSRPALAERHGVELRGKREPVRVFAPQIGRAAPA